jgi:hypothetical protein
MRRADPNRLEPLFWECLIGFVLSDDGKWMYLVSADDGVTLSRRSTVNGTTEVLFHTKGRPAFLDSLSSAQGNLYLAVSRGSHREADILEINPTSKAAKPILHVQGLPPLDASGFSVSPDGKSLVVSAATVNHTTIYLAPSLRR